jgi:hypothetical protein
LNVVAELRVTTKYGGIYAIVPRCPGAPWGESPYSEHHFGMPVYSGHLWWKKYWHYCVCGARIPDYARHPDALPVAFQQAANKMPMNKMIELLQFWGTE